LSFILFATCAAAVAAGAGLVAARRARREPEDDEQTAAPRPPPPVVEPPAIAGLPLAVGDVVSVEVDDPARAGGIGRAHSERWLEGALVLKEGAEVVGAVFVAPEGIRHEAVVAFAAPRRDIGWLTPVALEVTGEPPTSLELGGIVMQRKRRLFVEIERLGRGAPVVRGGAVFAEYEATGRAMGIVLVLGASAVHAWHGARYEPAEYDHWGRGS
jgi:hypothetical protein